MEEKIIQTRKRWQQNVNGPNEVFAKRDQERLNNASVYEEILRNRKLLVLLDSYYNNRDDGNILEFSKEYFKIISTSKNISEKDLDFYFDYFKDEKKNRKIIEPVIKEKYKVIKTVPDKKDKSEKDEPIKRKNNNQIIVNLFQKQTIMVLNDCQYLFNESTSNTSLYNKYPELENTLFDLIGLNKIENIEEFKNYISILKEKAYNDKQENGNEYMNLVNIFNKLYDMIDYSDVVDNFEEFKLLIKYPKLTPYMYQCHDMKHDTLKLLFSIAKKEYAFIDLNDFIINYFLMIYDNFNIQISSIRSLIKKAGKTSKTSKILKSTYKKINESIKPKDVTIIHILFYLCYAPLLLLLKVCQLFSLIIDYMYVFAVGCAILILILCNLYFPNVIGFPNMLSLIKVFMGNQWYELICQFWGGTVETGFLLLFPSMIYIIILLCIYALPAILIGVLLGYSSSIMTEVDLYGIQRTIVEQLLLAKNRIVEEYKFNDKYCKIKYVKRILINSICMIFLVLLIMMIG